MPIDYLYESIWSGYGALFEANAGAEMRKGVDYLEYEYGIPRKNGRPICQAVRRFCFDVFSSDHTLNDKTKDPAVKAVLGLFMPVLRFACEKFRVQYGSPESMQSVEELGEKILAFGKTSGIHPGPGGSILTDDGSQVTLDDILSRSGSVGNAAPVKTYSGHSRYTVVPITSHMQAQEYAGSLPFCLTWSSKTYWNQYTDHARYKCYFLLRDDYLDITAPAQYNDDDDFARSAIALIVNSDGSIRSLFNRRNHVNKIYDEEQVSQFLCRPFREVCVPYTEAESEAANEQNNKDLSAAYVRRPVTRESFVSICEEEFNWMSDTENNPDGADDAYFDEAVSAVAAEQEDIIYTDDDSWFVSFYRIVDESDNKSYMATFFVGIDNYSIERITDWVECPNENGQISKTCYFPFKFDLNDHSIIPLFDDADNVIYFVFNNALYRFEPNADVPVAGEVLKIGGNIQKIIGISFRCPYEDELAIGYAVAVNPVDPPDSPLAPYGSKNGEPETIQCENILVRSRKSGGLIPMFKENHPMTVSIVYYPASWDHLFITLLDSKKMLEIPLDDDGTIVRPDDDECAQE